MKKKRTNNSRLKPYKFIISGGGTGGHIFPAVAIAHGLRKVYPNCDVLFVGANNRMEMEKIPQEGFSIVGLDVAGLKRSFSLENLKVLWKFIRSYFKAKKLVKKFKPDCAIGTGGYVSLPVMYAAAGQRVKTVIWEGNGFPGLTNKVMAKKADLIFTGFPKMEKYFPADKIIFSGNPVRSEVLNLPESNKGKEHFGLNTDKPVLFITGGSLGARSINECIQQNLKPLTEAGIQIIWQTGKNFQAQTQGFDGVYAAVFIKEMEMAYAAADAVISRAGALSISEIAVTAKPVILVPSPNVTDDHQTKNAGQLTHMNAALMVKDAEVNQNLIATAIKLLEDKALQNELTASLLQLAKPHATEEIVQEIIKLLSKNERN